MAHNPFPDPAAVLPGEAEMLAAVLADLSDDLPKLVYADWLEERGDPRGPFLRAFTTAARSGGKLPDRAGFSKAWLDLTGITAVSAAREHDLPISPDDLLRGALPALTFQSEPASNADILIGASKFGGDPDVPPGFVWPEYQGRPLSFLAQFNLEDLPRTLARQDMPSCGLLSVFYSIGDDLVFSDDAGGWRTFFLTGTIIRRHPTPTAVSSRDRTHSCRLLFTETLMLPEHRDFELDEHRVNYRNEVSNTKLGHQLLGYPRWLQYESWASGTLEDLPAVRHLLTLDGDQNAGWTWGDAGLLYFGISADDLKAGRFDRTLFEFQCC